jgi:hypothetical protein
MPHTPSAGYTCLGIAGKPHGRYLGEATFRAPSGAICVVAVYRDQQVWFDTLTDPEVLAPGSLLREAQVAMRQALHDMHPELFVDAADDPEPRGRA